MIFSEKMFLNDRIMVAQLNTFTRTQISTKIFFKFCTIDKPKMKRTFHWLELMIYRNMIYIILYSYLCHEYINFLINKFFGR